MTLCSCKHYMSEFLLLGQKLCSNCMYVCYSVCMLSIMCVKVYMCNTRIISYLSTCVGTLPPQRAESSL